MYKWILRKNKKQKQVFSYLLTVQPMRETLKLAITQRKMADVRETETPHSTRCGGVWRSCREKTSVREEFDNCLQIFAGSNGPAGLDLFYVTSQGR